jgi:endonuclease/exonuclease/phosphatase family metal-dependent hydrolase
MPVKLRRLTNKILLACNIIVVVFFLLACLAPYLNPRQYWYISMLGLGFAVFFALVILMFFLWLILKPKYALISAVALIIGWKSISVFIAFNKPSAFKDEKQKGDIRIVTWNVARFIELSKNNNRGSQTRTKMMELLKQQNADILCLEEFQTSTNPRYYDNIRFIQKNLNYPYYYFSFDEDGSRLYYSSIIFSRFPIVDTGVVYYPRPTISEALIHADIKYQNDTFRVYATHLQSVQFQQTDYQKFDEITSRQDSILENSKTIFYKLRTGIYYRSIQADIVNQLLQDCPHPILFCGDLNDVPNSYTYFKIRDDMQDAFLKKGFGIGRTFSALSPTLRIDYIFASNDFKIRQYDRLVRNYSDHYMLVADVKLIK